MSLFESVSVFIQPTELSRSLYSDRGPVALNQTNVVFSNLKFIANAVVLPSKHQKICK